LFSIFFEEARRLFGAKENIFSTVARTWVELADVLKNDKLKATGGLKMVEVFLDREDVPKEPLLDLLETQKSKGAKS
jgi:pyruvate decarboxylase